MDVHACVQCIKNDLTKDELLIDEIISKIVKSQDLELSRQLLQSQKWLKTYGKEFSNNRNYF